MVECAWAHFGIILVGVTLLAKHPREVLPSLEKTTSTKEPGLEHHSSKAYNDYQTGGFDAGIKARAENNDYIQMSQVYKFLIHHCRKSTSRLDLLPG